MQTYEFRLTLAGEHEHTDALADKLYAGGCDDGLVGSKGLTVGIDFCREAASYDAAVASAIACIERAGFAVVRAQAR